MLHTHRFSLQNAVYFIMLHFFVPVFFTFYILGVLKFKCENSGAKKLNVLHTLCFSLQNAIYFIILPFLFSVLFTFYLKDVLKFKRKTPVPKG
jgi:small-conductance mechanosensitive channel